MPGEQGNPETPLERLICPFCCKTFEHNKQASRHVRYCRTKAKVGLSTRRRSCVVCIKAKTRCDIALPSCSRCTTKGLQCLYKSSNAPSALGAQDVSVDERVAVVHHVEAGGSQNFSTEQTASDSNHLFARRGNSPYDLRHLFERNIFDPPPSTDPWVDLQSNPGTSNVDRTVRSTLPLGTTFSDGMLDLVSSEPFSWNYGSDAYLLAQIHHFKDRIILGSYYVASLSPPFCPLDTKTILGKRDLKAGPYGSALSRAYCMSALKSYPGMLCGNDVTLPPFIHLRSRPSLRKTYSNNLVALPEPLAICSSIMQMYMAKSPGNVAFIWRTIQAESQRIEDEYRLYDAWNTLASIQAMTIYIILGLLGDNTEYVADENIISPILSTTKRMADKYRPAGWMCNGEVQHGEIPAWEEWVLAESRRRYFAFMILRRRFVSHQANIYLLRINSTAIVIAIIIHIFNIEHGPGLPQCGGFGELSLPCSKTLWQASDQATWEAEYRKQYMRDNSSSRGLKRIPTYRDLLPDLQDENDPTSASRMADLSVWFSGMDDLGTLVTMTVSTL